MLHVEAEAPMRAALLLLWLKLSLFPSDLSLADPTQYFSSSEVVIPLKVTYSARRAKTPGWLSYSLILGGKRHIIHIKVKKLFLSTHLPVFTYDEQQALLKDYPFIPSDCYYHGYVEGAPESLVVFSVCSGGFRGVLQINDLSYEIEPMRHSSTFEHLVYRLKSNMTQFPLLRCGLTDKGIARQHLGFEKVENSALKQKPSDKWWTHPLFLELVVVIDHEFFTYSQSNVSKVQEDVFHVVSIVDSTYQQLNTYVTLIGIEIWNHRNVFPMINIRQVLNDFAVWKQISLSQLQYDAAHIFIKSSLIKILGIAYVAGICNPPLDCGVENFQEDPWSLFANTVAHELGHTLGMKHDENFCSCGEVGCVMSTFRVPADRFTDCSYNDFMKTTLNQGSCLYNHPKHQEVFLIKRCGNGMVEREEECDCGSMKQCEQDSCCTLNCTLRSGAACAFGLCCKNCNFLPSGELCRQKVSECDLPEWCNGTSHQCPEDGYVQDGVPCGVNAYCYQKQCNNHDQQCREIFGKGARSAAQNCYKKINSQGNKFGHCGINGTRYLKCNVSDVFCGRVHCENVEHIPHLQDHSLLQHVHINGITCWSTDHHLGMSIPDAGEVKDGTTCGPGKICIHKKCVNLSVLSQVCLPETCNQRGVCNNKHHCHCDYGWSLPYCLHRGFGGSVDSGPTSPKKRGFFTPIVTLLPVLICLLIFGLYIYNRQIHFRPKEETKAYSPVKKTSITSYTMHH